jgi:uncharacterized protein YndB with AHSA1/START domain
MIQSAIAIEDLTLAVTEEIRVEASLEATFAALLEQMGPLNETPDGTPLPMLIEAWPGGRWVRELGKGADGHLWGHVQAIRRPDLLEISGPLFMSYPVCNNVQYRLTTDRGATRITLRHTALGLITDEHRAGLGEGWRALLKRVAAASGHRET